MALSKDLREYLDKKMNEELKEVDNRVNALVKANTEEAFKTDPTSEFGGIIAFNRQLDKATAEAIIERQFVEVIIAP